ncbi:MAG: LuxR C-terminal-related transcriptional regulator [Treponema sp.]|jgi:DNA-binding CsgD family transcriptional regulator|nr:LuxR C-terminal-related transcriptional regulator [Treponema sp.]
MKGQQVVKTDDRPDADNQDKEKANQIQTFKYFFTSQSLIHTLIIILAFTLLVFLCSYFMGSIERRHIRNDAKSALDTTELNIISDIDELEKLLNYISETVRVMIIRGDNYDMVSEYITYITKYLFADEELKIYTTGIHGFFDVFGGRLHEGNGWQPSDGYVPSDRPWYRTAVDASGETAVTEPYKSAVIEGLTLTFTRRIFNEEGNPLGIVCLNILFDKVREHAVNTRFAHNGYGLLLNSQLEILAHPDEEIWGKALSDLDNFKPLASDLKQGIPVLESRMINYKKEASVVFARQLKNGWYIGVIIPEKTYFRGMSIMRLALITLGVILAALFIILYLRLQKARKELQYYDNLTHLTPRQLEIFHLLLTGLPAKQIAGELTLSEPGVNFHIKNLYQKLGIQSRTELLSKYVNKPNSD